MINITRIFDFPYYQLEKYNLNKSLTTKYGDTWVSISTQSYVDQANAISRSLLRLGVKPNDKIAVISTTNRTEWNVIDIGVLQIGAQNVPIYPTISETDYEYILNHSEATYCFVSDIEVLEKLNKIKDNTLLKGVYTFDEIDNESNWKSLLTLGEDPSNQSEVQALMDSVKPDDLATLIYTSGTTGTPKGVMLSHNNIVSDVLSSEKRVPFDHGKSRALSFLPICHVFERMLLYLYQYCGVEIYFAESIDKMSDNLKEIHPHVMSAVPRLYEKVYDKIVAKGGELTGIKKALFFWAIDLGLRYEPYGKNGWWYEKQLGLARKLIFSKWKEALGGNIKIMVSGSAALQPRLTRTFAAAGIPIMEGYGLTETSPVISVNDQRNYGFRIGTVGKLIDHVEVKIAEDGEILVKGPNVMLGYYKDPEKTADVMTGDYFHTGDIGEISDDGFLKITDRKKEMFKTSGGKYVAPAVIENQLKQSRFIEQVMVIGEGQKMPAALIQPNFDFIKEWAKRHDIDSSNISILCKDERLLDRIQKEIDYSNQNFGKWEQIKAFKVTPEVWSIEKGHLTPTLKLKRKNIKEIYNSLINSIYNL
ncbi:AMP-dependent synthetase/ligase [Formosa algae]|uniref:Long-chain acyl-CoA synthetase n=1 Tax=Formosa algae TaxID=225843 RepID=A0A9X1CCW5_9FLAO|nr:AMP-dependent synthetase/ligase [Formosa algae]MBP1841547.1 long-chain acyl-CoA synthetase [Formosa algae]MDQ0337060.1 long-chain acyl-CoA synthetase [Formosa algae]OEI80172.1 AMP-dependent synthetase [Formosa algae]PNW27677.1 long-chain fatty acid--CoA ligase [Formosa algae]